MTELDLRIEKIVAGGDGLARHEGRVVFVPGSAPGERIRARPIREKTDYLKAVSLEVLESSPHRRPPPCPYYESCGGCRLMHLRPEAQLEAKRRILLEGIERVTREPYQRALPLHAANDVFYRNRLRFHVAFVGSKPIAGFRKRESREIVDIDRCLLGTETLNRVWERIRGAIAEDRRLARKLVAVELEESTDEPGRIAARFLVSSIDGLRAFEEGRRAPLLAELGLVGMVAAVDDDRGGGPSIRTGQSYVEHRVAGFTLRQSLGSFFQSNRFLLEDLVSTVIAGAEEEGASRGLDLFSGVGLFALPLSRKLPSVLGVESHSLALEDARKNAERAASEGSPRVRFLRGDASAYVARAKLAPKDMVILDPPRGGLSPVLIGALGKSPLRTIRYVSCDPPALSRDALRLRGHGFALEKLELFDLFPNTHHFETLATFTRQV
ncbi:MAG TPA: 23S rRNA (uracil(1939)-C(5))-methyltransferase RlmD [Vicinamibacteria bacterium]|jgi:23S rRNA (uracil1939-C5)-methyltransferase